MSDLLKEYDESTKKNSFYAYILRVLFWICFVSLGAIYFGNMLFGPYSLDTLLSLEATRDQLNKKISLLKEHNAKAQKDYFELRGLYPDEH